MKKFINLLNLKKIPHPHHHQHFSAESNKYNSFKGFSLEFSHFQPHELHITLNSARKSPYPSVYKNLFMRFGERRKKEN